jgi:RNA methyltransferase, TrmH family
MLSHSQAKYLASLQVKKYREKHGAFLVEGDKMVRELLAQAHIQTLGIFANEDWLGAQAPLLRPFSGKTTPVSEAELSKISALSSPNQVLAVAQMPSEVCDTSLPATELCLYLDGIQDPGNMGSILRVADWFGLPAVYCSPDCADVFAPKVVQASMGAIFRVKTWEIALPELLAASPQMPVAGAVLEGENLFEANLPGHGLLVIGNEGRGIAPEHLPLLRQRVRIPHHPAGGAESLNAAVAAGILVAAFRNR